HAPSHNPYEKTLTCTGSPLTFMLQFRIWPARVGATAFVAYARTYPHRSSGGPHGSRANHGSPAALAANPNAAGWQEQLPYFCGQSVYAVYLAGRGRAG